MIVENNVLTFLTSGNMSSIIAALEPIYQLCKDGNKQAILYIDTVGEFNCNSPRLNTLLRSSLHGKSSKMNETKFEFLKQLIEYQPYVKQVIEWTPDISLNQIDYNLNEIAYIVNNPSYYAYYDKDFEGNWLYLSQIVCGLKPKWNGPWLEVSNSIKTLAEWEAEKIRIEMEKAEQERLAQEQKVPSFIQNQNKEIQKISDPEPELEIDISGKKTLICRSVKGQSANSFFQQNANNINEKALFIGYDYEYEAFCQAYDISPERREISNAYEAAETINRMKSFIVNDSVFFWIALGLGKNIVHEIAIDGSRTTKFIDCPKIQYLIGSKFETFSKQLNQNIGHAPAIISPMMQNKMIQSDPSIPRFQSKEYQTEFNIMDRSTWPEQYKNQKITSV